MSILDETQRQQAAQMIANGWSDHAIANVLYSSACPPSYAEVLQAVRALAAAGERGEAG